MLGLRCITTRAIIDGYVHGDGDGGSNRGSFTPPVRRFPTTTVREARWEAASCTGGRLNASARRVAWPTTSAHRPPRVTGGRCASTRASSGSPGRCALRCDDSAAGIRCPDQLRCRPPVRRRHRSGDSHLSRRHAIARRRRRRDSNPAKSMGRGVRPAPIAIPAWAHDRGARDHVSAARNRGATRPSARTLSRLGRPSVGDWGGTCWLWCLTSMRRADECSARPAVYKRTNVRRHAHER